MTPPPARAEFSQFLRLAVRWGDMDVLGHVNNAKFFTYDESARIAYFEPLAQDDPRMFKDYGLILARIGCDFFSQLRFPADIDVALRIEKIGRSSLVTRGAVFSGEQPVAAVSAVIVWFDFVGQKAIAVPESVRAWIRAREVLAPIE